MTDPATPRPPEPLTKAGRRLLDGFAPMPRPDAQELHRRSAMGRRVKVMAGIVAIEQEAAARAAPEPSGLREAAATYRDAEWAMRIAHDETGERCESMDAHNALVDKWRAADAALADLLGAPSPFARLRAAQEETP